MFCPGPPWMSNSGTVSSVVNERLWPWEDKANFLAVPSFFIKAILLLRGAPGRFPWRNLTFPVRIQEVGRSLLFVSVARRRLCFSDWIYRFDGPKWQRLFQSRWKSPLKWIWWNRCRNLSQPHIQRARSRGNTSAPWRNWTSSAETRWEGLWTNMRAPWRFCSGRKSFVYNTPELANILLILRATLSPVTVS